MSAPKKARKPTNQIAAAAMVLDRPEPRPDRSAPVQRTTRPSRTPLGARNRLSFSNLDPNFVYRVINATDDRLERAQEAGYEFVESKQRLGDPDVMDAAPLGANVSKPVGGGTTGYLMRIPREFYEEDQKAKADRINEIENATKPDRQKGEYGEGLTTTKR